MASINKQQLKIVTALSHYATPTNDREIAQLLQSINQQWIARSRCAIAMRDPAHRDIARNINTSIQQLKLDPTRIPQSQETSYLMQYSIRKEIHR